MWRNERSAAEEILHIVVKLEPCVANQKNAGSAAGSGRVRDREHNLSPVEGISI
jgi:hypothetical protein